MKKLICILQLCAVVVFGQMNFTDVTITGTPYLTVPVLLELEQSQLSRGGRPGSGGGDQRANRQLLSFSTSVTEGDPANYMLGYVQRFAGMRDFCAGSLWQGWFNELPNPAGFIVDNPKDLAYTNQVDYFIAAGLSSNGWRSAFTYDPTIHNWRDFDDPMFIYRTNNAGQFASDFVAGEILGPWVVDDLQRAFNHAQHQVVRAFNVNTYFAWAVTTNGITAPKRYRGTTSSINDGQQTWEDARDLAISRWAPNTFTANIVQMYSEGSYSAFYGAFNADFQNNTGYNINFGRIDTNSVVFFFGAELNAYLKSEAHFFGSVKTFDANGLPFIVEGQHARIANEIVPSGIVTNSYRTTVPIGDASILPAAVEGVTTTNSASRGFSTDTYFIIYSPNHPYTR